MDRTCRTRSATPTPRRSPPSGDGGGLFASWRPNPPLAASEDCLFLNVWTPAADDKKRPVLVWFHGGGFTTGSGSSYAYDGVRLAKRGDVVVVTTNHRLNQFGYLNLAGYGEQFADSGAVGALDMIQSLEWVRDNIEAFGGDPANVLIFGESGGGSKVCTLMAMDKAQGPVPPRRRPVRPAHQSRAEGQPPAKAADEVVKKLGLTKDTIAEILTKPVADIQAAARRHPGAGSGPVLDGRSITRHPFDPDGPPQSADVPLLIGCNRTEGTSLTAADEPEPQPHVGNAARRHQDRPSPARTRTTIIDLYKKNHPDIEAPELFFMAGADNSFFRGSVTVADRKAQQGGAPVFFYMLDWETPGDGRQALRAPRARHRHGVRQRRQVGSRCPAQAPKRRPSPTRCRKAGSPSPRPAIRPIRKSRAGPPTRPPSAT